MEKTDFRILPEITRDAICPKALRLIKRGRTQGETANILEVHYNSVCTWRKKYQSGNLKLVKTKKRGVSSEQKKLLSNKQEEGDPKNDY